MALNPEQVDRLLKMIRQTREVELTCPECLDDLHQYVQSILDGRPIDGALVRVREHLDACPFCDEEFKLALNTLKAMEG